MAPSAERKVFVISDMGVNGKTAKADVPAEVRAGPCTLWQYISSLLTTAGCISSSHPPASASSLPFPAACCACLSIAAHPSARRRPSLHARLHAVAHRCTPVRPPSLIAACPSARRRSPLSNLRDLLLPHPRLFCPPLTGRVLQVHIGRAEVLRGCQ